MSSMEIAELRSLVAVAAFAGVGRAASALHVTQPTVSAHLRRLEATLGVALVERRGRSIAFTVAGESLVRDAHRIVALHDEALDRILGTPEDDIVVASTDMANASVLQTVSGVLFARHPERRVRFRFHRTDSLRRFVRTHTADVVLGYGDLGPGRTEIGPVPLAWFGAADTPADAGLVVFSAPCTLRDAILAAPGARGREVVRECLDLSSVLAGVRSGAGITALPAFHRAETQLRELALPAPPPLPLTMVASSRIPAETRGALVTALRRAVARV
ncbi:HTH-type transcriptional regulator TdfR [Microbacterium azadirachtae]|uniref:HTH-type transcriptional regulator TdfR n=1 Tax=Microbacterium azadirachtae TaxID=582680 RepID=A0A0F0KAD4_9MICO|nr:LysR family transcriptional regulator [Microbacterium azadirachtae]KJL17349.1 HTH-type transcriptional regulator TdfR [Microbacterium azadirachtae]